MVIVHSTTKGLAAMTLALAHSRGWLDYDDAVCKYWPEFAREGKEKITVRQLLAHQAGLFAFDEQVDRNVVADLDRLAKVHGSTKTGVGARNATGLSRHHVSDFTKANCYGGLIRSTAASDSSSRTKSLHHLTWISIFVCPESIPDPRLAKLKNAGPCNCCLVFPSADVVNLNPHSNFYRSLIINPGAGISIDEQHTLRTQPRSAVGRRRGHGASNCACYGVLPREARNSDCGPKL